MMWIDKGGPVIWILVVYSVLGVSIVLARYLQLLLTRRVDLNSDVAKWPETAEKRLVNQLLMTLSKRGHGADLRAMAVHHIAKEMKHLESGLKTVSVLAHTAPLLGLFGTITGMIKAFQVIEAAGGKVDATALAGGIWEAMLTTGVGLAVAIPLLILIHFWESALARYHWRLQSAASLILNEQEQEQLTSLNSCNQSI